MSQGPDVNKEPSAPGERPGGSGSTQGSAAGPGGDGAHPGSGIAVKQKGQRARGYSSVAAGRAGLQPAPGSAAAVQHSKKWWESSWFRITITVAMVAIAVFVVAREIKPSQFAQAFSDIRPWWYAAALAVGTLGWVGSAIPTRVFSPVPLSFKDALQVEVASSFVGVVAPAGLGSDALFIRYMDKKGTTTPQAVAVMMLVALSQFLTSLILIVFAILVVGINPKVKIPWEKVGWVALGIVVVAVLVLLIPKARAWARDSIKKVWNEAYPEAMWALKHPRQLLIAMGGALILSGSFIFSLWFCLLAFGQHTNLVTLAAVFMVFNTLGSAIPVPGGVGAVEGALTLGLTTIGIPSAVALSAVLAFRVSNFYLPIPVGAIMFTSLQKRGLV